MAETEEHSLRALPYRLFFPLGAILGGLGVSHWLLYTLGLQAQYSGQGHAFVQIQAFLMAYACGFMMTMVPRRTQTAPAGWVEIAVAAAALVIVTGASLRGKWIVAETAFLAILAVMAQFAIRRFLSAEAGRRPPNAFVLIPFGLIHGAVGAILILLSQFEVISPWGVGIGRRMMQEGMFLCLALGIGHMILPLLTGYAVPADADGSPQSRRERLLYVCTGVALLLTFPLEYWAGQRWGRVPGVRLAYGLRFAIVAYQVIWRMGAYRRPLTPGLQRRYLFISFWMLPLALGLVAAFPTYQIALLHVLFVGGFGLMTFAVSSHVIVAHGGFPQLVTGSPWQVRTFGLLFLFATITRVSADFLPSSYFLHLGAAAAVWLLALLVWGIFLVPKVLPQRTEREQGAAERSPTPS